MEFNINAGRMSNPVAFMVQPKGSDEYGQPKPLEEAFSAYADMDVKNGSQLAQLGEDMTTELITCLMYYDERATSSMWLRDLQSGIDYQVQHIRPSRRHQSMIVTAKVEMK